MNDIYLLEGGHVRAVQPRDRGRQDVGYEAAPHDVGASSDDSRGQRPDLSSCIHIQNRHIELVPVYCHHPWFRNTLKPTMGD